MTERHARGVRAGALLCVALALPALLVMWRKLWISYGVYDEGLILYGAERVLSGDIPYADFWTLYAPGQYYLLAMLFSWFEPLIVVERWLSLATVAANVGFAAAFVYRLSGPAWAAIAGAASAAWLAQLSMFGSPLPVSTALVLATLALLDRATSGGAALAVVAAGVTSGLAVWFRHDVGALACAASLATLAFACGSQAERRQRVIRFAAGLIVALLPGGLLLFWAVPLSTLVDSLLIFPATGFRAQRGLPFPALEAPHFAFYAVPLLLGLGLLRGVLARRAGHDPAAAWWCALGLGMLLLQQVAVRSDMNHMLPSLLLAIVVTCGLSTDGRGEVRILRSATLLVAALGLLPALLGPVSWLRAGSPPLVTSSLPRAQGVRIPPPKQAYEEVVRFVRERTRPGEVIFVGNRRHDRLLFNDVVFYFLAERPAPGPYHELHPGVATTAPVQERLVRDLDGVETLVLASIAGDEPNQSSRSSGVTLLDDAIRRDFRVVYRKAGYEVLERR
jgi:hypothetical protein